MLDERFHAMWPIMLGIYYVNASVVVMNYQFVNGLLMTMAGMLAAQQHRANRETKRERVESIQGMYCAAVYFA